MQERRQKYEANPKLAWDILEEGSAKARKVAEATMVEAREAANLSHEYEPPANVAGR
jgi:tryptophanyl-tRNA synthetase